MMRPNDVRGGLDTSVLVRLLTGEPASLSRAAYAYLAETQSRQETVRVSNLVIAEAYFACQHHYGLSKAAVLSGLRKLLGEPVFALDDRTRSLLGHARLATMKPGFVDRLIHGNYAKEGLTLVTFEKAARKLENVEILSDNRPRK